MHRIWQTPLFRSRYALAALAGLMLAMAFPKAGVAGLAWIAPGLMVAAGRGRPGWERFRIGYLAGLVFYLASLSWLLLIPYRWLGLPVGPAAGWLALGAYLALYPAVWVWLVELLRTRANSWISRTCWALASAALWVGLEMVLARLMTGFPWNLAGTSQYQLLPLIQIASVTGVYGISFLVIWTSLALYSAADTLIREPSRRHAWIVDLCLPLVTLATLFNLGLREVSQKPPAQRFLKVALVQPSIPQTLIWDSSRDDERFQALLALTRQALSNPVDVVIWPEAALPKLLRFDRPVFEAVTGLARQHRVWMIIGADDAEPLPAPKQGREALFFNSCFLISPEGRVANTYRKQRLVVFGEYIPLGDWLPFLKFLTPIDGGFSRGPGPVRFDLPGLEVSTSPLICFEDIFPSLGRAAAGDDTDFLVNLTNNGWFGEGAAQWQHAIGSVFRAIENRRPLVRCANNGLTCWVDSHGRIREMFRDEAGRVYGPGHVVFDLPLPLTRPELTFYQRHGDLFGWSCAALAGAVFLPLAARRRG